VPRPGKGSLRDWGGRRFFWTSIPAEKTLQTKRKRFLEAVSSLREMGEREGDVLDGRSGVLRHGKTGRKYAERTIGVRKNFSGSHSMLWPRQSWQVFGDIPTSNTRSTQRSTFGPISPVKTELGEWGGDYVVCRRRSNLSLINEGRAERWTRGGKCPRGSGKGYDYEMIEVALGFRGLGKEISERQVLRHLEEHL